MKFSQSRYREFPPELVLFHTTKFVINYKTFRSNNNQADILNPSWVSVAVLKRVGFSMGRYSITARIINGDKRLIRENLNAVLRLNATWTFSQFVDLQICIRMI